MPILSRSDGAVRIKLRYRSYEVISESTLRCYAGGITFICLLFALLCENISAHFIIYSRAHSYFLYITTLVLHHSLTSQISVFADSCSRSCSQYQIYVKFFWGAGDTKMMIDWLHGLPLLHLTSRRITGVDIDMLRRAASLRNFAGWLSSSYSRYIIYWFQAHYHRLISTTANMYGSRTCYMPLFRIMQRALYFSFSLFQFVARYIWSHHTPADVDNYSLASID